VARQQQQPQQKPQHIPTNEEFVSAAALVAGTTVGAGILALPQAISNTGVIPSSLVLGGTWAFMATTGLLISEVATNLVALDSRNDGLGILAITNKLFSKSGSVFAGLVYVFIHYALLIAYISAAGDIISDYFNLPDFAGPLIFAPLVGGTLTFGSTKLIEQLNNGLVVVVAAAFAFLILLGLPSVKASNLLQADFSAASSSIPVMFVALVYHNIVPTVSASLHYNKKAITKAILLGSGVPVVMYMLWNAIILGIAGMASGKNFPDPVDLLRQGSSGELTGNVVSVFSEAAIITSFTGFVLGLLSFYNDLKIRPGQRDLLLYALVLVPPTLIATFYPEIFTTALDVAGTYGISVLFGLVPVMLAYKLRDQWAKDKDKQAIEYQTFVPGGNLLLATLFVSTLLVIGTKIYSS